MNKPFANYIAKDEQHDETLFFASQVLRQTKSIFSKGTGNNYLDLMQNFKRCAELYKIIYSDRTLKLPLEDMAKRLQTDGRGADVMYKLLHTASSGMHETIFFKKALELLSLKPEEIDALSSVVESIVKAYEHELGNCFYMSNVAMYLSTFLGRSSLDSVSIMGSPSVDHALMKLDFKDGETIFIDPWFKNEEFEGAVFNVNSAKQYYRDVSDILRMSQTMSVLGMCDVYKFHAAALFMLYARTKSELSEILDPLGFSLAAMICLLLFVQANMLLHKHLLSPNFKEIIKLINSENKQALTFDLLQSICEENNIPKPVTFSTQANAMKRNACSLSDLCGAVEPDQAIRVSRPRRASI